MRSVRLLTFVVVIWLSASLQAADQPLIGIAPVVLDAPYYDFDTAEQYGIRVRVLARGLPCSFVMAFLLNGDMLIFE